MDEGIKDGTFRAMNTRQAALFILETLAGFFEASVARDETPDIEADLKELMEFYLHGLSPIRKMKAYTMRGSAFKTDCVGQPCVRWAEAVESTEGRGTTARMMLPVEPIGVTADRRSDNRPLAH